MRTESHATLSPLSVEASYQHAEALTRQYARTFYFASALLPPAQRKHAYAIYAFCRTADSLVDEAEEGHAKEDIQARLSELRRFVQAPHTFVPDYPWVRAFQETLSALAIPVHLFVELLNGVEMDLYKSRYATFAELYLYCYRVAGVVGQMMCYVYGLTDEASLSYAEKLGVAMQLTNILRDVGEDWGRGRLYIPQEMLRKFGVSEAEIGAKQATPAYEALIRDQIAQARAYYREAAPGIARIPSVPIRLTTLVMARLYEGILDKLEKHPVQNLTQRTALSRLEKYLLTGQTFLGLTPVGSKPLPAFYRLAVAFLLLLTPFAVVDTLTGAFAGMAGLSDSLYLLLWGGAGAYLVAVRQATLWKAWALSTLLGYGIELIGTQTGYPFGPYHYTDVLQPQVLGIPIAIAIAWGSLVGLWGLLGPQGRLKRALWVAIGAVATDVLLEPYATAIRGYWQWETPAIPLANYLSWGVFAALLSLLYPRRTALQATYPDVLSNLGRVLLSLLVLLLLVANLVQGQRVFISFIAAITIVLLLLWRRI
jgi:phytoene synthase